MTLMFLCFAALPAQVSFTVSYKRVSPTEIDVVFQGKADPGWHIYSTGIGDDGPTPATFNIDKSHGIEPAGKLKPGPGEKRMNDPIFEMPVVFFEGTAVFTQRLRITEKDYELKGYLQYGACNDESCLPPTAVECKVSGTDGPAAGEKKEAAPSVPAETAVQIRPSGRLRLLPIRLPLPRFPPTPPPRATGGFPLSTS